MRRAIAAVGMDLQFDNFSSAESALFDLEIDPEMPALPMAQAYRKHGRKLDSKMRRKLLQQVVAALMKESKGLVTRSGIVTRKTEILPYSPGRDWDMESSIDKIISNMTYHSPTYRDLFRREILRSRRCFVILADKSNSLGPVIDYVAMAVSILAEAVKTEDYALLFFDDTVRTIKGVNDAADQAHVLEEILNIECQGATNLHRAFTAAKQQLDAVPVGTEGVCVVISDCIPTCGGDPIKAAALFPRMEILLVQNKGIAIGHSSIDRLEKLPGVKIRTIRELNDIIDAVQELVSYGESAFV